MSSATGLPPCSWLQLISESILMMSLVGLAPWYRMRPCSLPAVAASTWKYSTGLAGSVLVAVSGGFEPPQPVASTAAARRIASFIFSYYSPDKDPAPLIQSFQRP